MNKINLLSRSVQPQRMPLVWLLLLFLLLTSCLGGGGEAAQDAVAPETAALQTGTLTCSDNCRNQGQCGTAVDGRIVILAHGSQPATRDHNAVLENDSPILIVQQEQRTVADPVGTLSNLNFFAVQPAAGGPTNWVAGSCVNPTPLQ
ncbi:hypothetical protein MNBD_CHLOROFLEXI01-148 [hydrothermal vent metagenome]|uniref:Uncharacterized protein n=1 Tax=hydrothermal vent metagenome TaxID=652676 RepID=A0A3B0V544_9ZZZZ